MPFREFSCTDNEQKNYEQHGELYHSECPVEPLLRLTGENEQVSLLINGGPTGLRNATRSRVR